MPTGRDPREATELAPRCDWYGSQMLVPASCTPRSVTVPRRHDWFEGECSPSSLLFIGNGRMSPNWRPTNPGGGRTQCPPDWPALLSALCLIGRSVLSSTKTSGNSGGAAEAARRESGAGSGSRQSYSSRELITSPCASTERRSGAGDDRIEGRSRRRTPKDRAPHGYSPAALPTPPVVMYTRRSFLLDIRRCRRDKSAGVRTDRRVTL